MKRFLRGSLATLGSLALVISTLTPAFAAVDPKKIYSTESKKKNTYVQEGLFVGGDQALDEIAIRDIRYSKNTDFERLVLDVEGNQAGQPVLIERAPYYHVELSAEAKRMIFTVWGKARLLFDAKRVADILKGSPRVKSVEFLPIIEKDRWVFAVTFQDPVRVEAFELAQPVRIIIDFKN